jgi:hypothetical protein
MQRVERRGQDQTRGHQAQERGEHLKAQYGQRQNEAGANEDIEKEGGGSPFEFGIGIVQCAHGCPLMDVSRGTHLALSSLRLGEEGDR